MNKVLKVLLKKFGMEVLIGFFWLGIGNSGRLLYTLMSFRGLATGKAL